MYCFGSGVPIDIDNEEDGLVMRLSGLYRSCLMYKNPLMSLGRQGVSEDWFKCNIHKDLVAVCNKFDDKKWFDKGQNCYCIYYACAILGYMAQYSEYGALRIANEPKIVSTLMLIWEGNHLAWVESRCAIKTIYAMIRSAPQLLTNFLHNDAGIDFVKVVIYQYGQCLFDTIKGCAIVPNKIEPGYLSDLMGIIKGKSMSYDPMMLRDIGIDLGQEWMSINGTVLSYVAQIIVKADKTRKNKAQSEANKKKFFSSFNNVDVEIIEKACALDLCWTMMYKTPQYEERDSFIDCAVYLSHFEEFCRKFGESQNVVEWLVVRLRCCNTLNDRFDLIINNLLRLDLIDKKYYPDLANTLVPLLEVGVHMDNMRLSAGFSDYLPIFDSIVSSLKIMFNLASEFEFVPVENITKYQCRACKNIVKYPYKMKFCKHNYCFLCIFYKLSSNPDSDMRKCMSKSCKSDEFDWFAWKRRHYSLANAVKMLQIKTSMPGNRSDDFIGTQLEFWEYVEQVRDVINKDKILPDEKFDYFVDYMKKEASVMQVSDLKDMRQQALDKKMEGNKCFKQNEWESAILFYKEALRLCPKQYNADRVIYFNNLALTYIKLGDYLNAYYSCLSGLAFNAVHVKLGYNLVQCYDNLKFDEMFINISDNQPLVSYYKDCPAVVLEKVSLVGKAHSFAKMSFLKSFSSNYSAPKIAKQLGLDLSSKKETTAEELKTLQHQMQIFNKSDSVSKLTSRLAQDAASDIHFIMFYLSQFHKKYMAFLERYETTKRQIYRFMFDSLASRVEQENSGELETKASIKSKEMYKMVKANFKISEALRGIESDLKQNLLIHGFYNVSFEMCAVQALPTDLSGIIVGYLFSKSSYDFEGMKEWTVTTITEATGSKLATKWSSKDDHVQFKDDEDCLDNNWKDIEFDDDESCAGEFLKLL